MKKYLFITVTVFSLCGCNHTDRSNTSSAINYPSHPSTPNSIVRSDTSLHLINGTWFYRHEKFSGAIKTYYPNGALQSQQTFYNGKEEGLLSTYYENSHPDSRRFYHNGEKDSINQGWWINGNPRFEYHFKNGVYEGDFKEWYASGRLLKHIIYHNGKEQSGKGWRENGKTVYEFCHARWPAVWVGQSQLMLFAEK